MSKIASIAATGLEWIEIAALQAQHLNIWDDEWITPLVEGLPRTGLRVWSFHAPFCGIAMDDEATREYAIDA